MNVGILFPSRSGGGVFQYALSVADSLNKYSTKFDYKIICDCPKDDNYMISLGQHSVIYLPGRKSSFRSKTVTFFNLFNLVFKNKISYIPKNEGTLEETLQLKKFKIEFLIIPFPSLSGFYNKIPYVVSIPDLMHKYYPSFPEYPLKERLMRNIIYKNAAKHSLLTVVDAQQGIDDLNRFFRIQKEKVRVIPYIPPGYVYEHKNMDLKTAEKILEKYNLPERFLFYPAQFWYHKNHIGLTKALEHIKQTYKIKISVVLVGSPQESYERIMSYIRENDMTDQIIHPGYVSDKEVVALYKKAVALVFPSLFGPTNIPPLEAMVLGTPVACSNLFSMPEQLGEAGLLFDPNNIKDMAEKIYRIWTDGKLRQELIENGYKKSKDMTLENYAKQWEQVIEEAVERIKQ